MIRYQESAEKLLSIREMQVKALGDKNSFLKRELEQKLVEVSD
jgi:hypothetical protein